MLNVLLNYDLLRVLWKIDLYLISTLVNKSLYLFITFHKVITQTQKMQT